MNSRLRLLAPFVALLVVFAVRPIAAADHNTLTHEEIADGWILLFDGESLFGWEAATKADWRVADGAIVVSSGEPGLLNTTSRFADYVLKVDFRSAKGTNSGVFLRTDKKPKNPKEGCYELNIADFGTTPFATGSLVSRGEKAKVAENLDSAEWQSFEVRCEGKHINIRVDGKQVLDYTEELDPKPSLVGHVGLQLNSGKVEFRNVKLKPLSQKPLFNGKNLDGWVPHPDLKNAFSVGAEGVLHAKGGKSQLESTTKFGDFTLQLAARANAPRNNSGLFFRSIPGEVMNGYECQLQNCYGKDDKPNPVDCGTGGICRRAIARKLVAKDGEWFHLALVADGPHMAAWVNGYQVSDFTDTREPHANPRNGLRTVPGTFILQAHDETTDFSFRNIQAAELPK
ncbi:MAG: DUF1080 domain-containing protein [Planctomycetota bacterium]|nr:MAG: DUF1080 domain-containing protein [Planctomycetota bacterium]